MVPIRTTSAYEYRSLPLAKLAELIVEHSDTEAINELHGNRCLFRSNGRQLRLVEYIEVLSKTATARRMCGGNRQIIEHAYDLTLDRFYNLPSEEIDESKAQKDTPACKKQSKSEKSDSTCNKRKGPDCRNQFRVFWDHLHSKLEKSHTSQLQQEVIAASELQELVTRHFWWACKECRRKFDHLVKRYYWKVNSGTICVRMPKEMDSNHCRRWLEQNVQHPDPSRSNEKARVQDIVDEQLFHRKIFSFADSYDRELDDVYTYAVERQLFQSVLDDITVKGLSQVVAEEKADNIEQQRPKIRALGKRKLRKMIQHIFKDLSCDKYQDGRIAQMFELSKSTFSRFAGSRWSETSTDNQPGQIPDLWLNTAQTLSCHPDFIEASKQMRIWPRVQEICQTFASDEGGL